MFSISGSFPAQTTKIYCQAVKKKEKFILESANSRHLLNVSEKCQQSEERYMKDNSTQQL